MRHYPLNLRLKSRLRRLVDRFKPDPFFFLKHVTGVIHVGANLGQERELYAEKHLNVLWIEPIPEVFARLQDAIAGYPKQKALRHLVTDVDNGNYVFHISNNEGASSSIFDLSQHQELWPEVTMTKAITLQSLTLSTLVNQSQIDLRQYDSLVMDTQGSELLVLKGAADILSRFKFIKAEAADFESYKDCCRLSEIDEFLRSRSFRMVLKNRFKHKAGVGSYYDVVFAWHG